MKDFRYELSIVVIIIFCGALAGVAGLIVRSDYAVYSADCAKYMVKVAQHRACIQNPVCHQGTMEVLTYMRDLKKGVMACAAADAIEELQMIEEARESLPEINEPEEPKVGT